MSSESISAAGIEAGHTPGPWVAFDYSDMQHPDELGPWFVIGPREFHTVAEVRPGNSDDGLPAQTPANARLIAASPTMFDYVARRATAGDAEACEIMEAIHAPR